MKKRRYITATPFSTSCQNVHLFDFRNLIPFYVGFIKSVDFDYLLLIRHPTFSFYRVRKVCFLKLYLKFLVFHISISLLLYSKGKHNKREFQIFLHKFTKTFLGIFPEIFWEILFSF